MLQTKPKKIITKEGALAELCKRSLYRFFKEFLPVIEPSADTYVWGKHIEYLCNEAQILIFKYINGEPTYHLNINICPGATKSTIFSRILTAWTWTVFPEATTINVSRDSNNVKEFALKSKEIIKSEKYKRLFPYVQMKKEPDSMFYFENTLNGRRYGLTTKSSGSTGKHADFHVYDDIYAYTDTISNTTIESLESSVEGYLSRFKDKERGVVINVMQRLDVKDPTAFLFKGYQEKKPKLKNYKNICLPAILSDLVEPEEAKELYTDGYLDPIRLHQNILDQEKLKYGYKYDAQFLQKPYLDKKGLMYPELTYFNTDMPEGSNFSFTDVADTGDDFLCTWFVKATNDRLLVYDAIYTKAGSGVTIPLMAEKMNRNKCVINWIESNNQGSVFVSQLSEKVANIQGVYETSNKITRIMHHSHLVTFLEFKETGSSEYLRAIDDLKHMPRMVKNKGAGMDIDSADALTALIRYFYNNYPQYFIIR